MDVLRLEHVSRVFGAVKAVDDLSLSLKQGEVVGFLGTNGAGKTTTIKMLLGILRPTEGTISVMGGDPADPATRLRVGYMPETAYYYPYLNARELLEFYGGLCGMDRRAVRARADVLLEQVDLAEAAERPLKTCSKGMLQRAGIAQALLADMGLADRAGSRSPASTRSRASASASCFSACAKRASRSSSLRTSWAKPSSSATASPS